MFSTNIIISFSNPFSDSFPINTKEVTQIRDNIVCVVVLNVFVLPCALTTSRCNVFQKNFGNQEESQFYGPNFWTMLFLVTIQKLIKSNLMRAFSDYVLSKYVLYTDMNIQEHWI